MMFLFAEAQDTPVLVAQKIAPPTSAGPRSETKILGPNNTKPAEQSPDTETPEQRKKRLLDNGILEIPPPPAEKKGRIGKDLQRMADKSKLEDGTLAPVQFKVEGNFGSWFALLPAADTKVEPDFSYGFAISYPLESNPVGEVATTSRFVSFVGEIYNAALYQKYKDPTGEKTQLYSAFNSSEFGFGYTLVSEKKRGEAQTLAATLRVQYLPLRSIKSEYRTIYTIPKTSEAIPRHSFSALGVGGMAAVSWGYARLATFGLFTGVSMATPTQLRLRFGVTFELMSFQPADKNQSTDKNSNENKTQPAEKIQNLDKSLPTEKKEDSKDAPK